MDKTKDYCPKCRHLTNHKCLFIVSQQTDYSYDLDWEENYETIQCLGCDNIQFRERYRSEDMVRYTDDGIESYYESKYYPKSLNNHLLIKNQHYLAHKLRIVYIETIEALKNNCYLLAGVGLRAIIEAICLNENISGKNLETKINNLVRNNLITSKDGNRLHGIRFLGNDSVHEMDVPKEEKLRIALDIAEHLIKNLYLMDIDADQYLDTIISDYEAFKNLFLKKFRMTIIKIGDEKNIKEVLKKDYRRVEASYLPNFMAQLIDEIKNNMFADITLGKTDNSEQYFIKN